MTNQDEQARALLTQQRQQAEHSQNNRLERSEETLHQLSSETVDEKARQGVTKQRQQTQHSQDNQLERSEEDLH
ncbi:MAG: hypothetical protein WBA99_18925 [Nodosilinea sp.]